MSSSEKNERLIRVVNEHWMAYVVPVSICFLMFTFSIGLFLLAGSSVYHSEWIWHFSFVTGSLLLLSSLHGLFLIFLNESVSQILVTNRRVIRFHSAIPFSDSMLEVTFEKMKTVESKKRGILRSLLNFGSLHFEREQTVIDYVPHPNTVVRDIEQAMGMR